MKMSSTDSEVNVPSVTIVSSARPKITPTLAPAPVPTVVVYPFAEKAKELALQANKVASPAGWVERNIRGINWKKHPALNRITVVNAIEQLKTVQTNTAVTLEQLTTLLAQVDLEIRRTSPKGKQQ